MKFNRGLLVLASLLLCPGAIAQGLIGFAGDDDFYSGLPFTTSLGVDFGWDSNPAATSFGDEQSSAFMRGGAEFAWGGGSRTTPIRLAGTIGGLYYFEKPRGLEDDFFWNSRINANLKHDINRRLTVGANMFLSYEIEPDYAIGFSLQSRTEQYLYGHASFWASYQLSRLWNTVTRYSISGIHYDENISNFENRFTQQISQEFRYQWTRRMTLTGEYRFAHTDFDRSNRDSDSHYLLGGFDHHITRALTSHWRAGAQFRDDESTGETTRPYAELAYRYRLAERTSLHFANRLSLEDSDLRSFGDRYTWRSVLSARHEITSRLSGSASLAFLHNNYNDSVIGRQNVTENLVSGTLGLTYRVLTNLDLRGTYSFTTVSSDDEFQEYDRNRFSLGLSTTF